MRYEWGLAVGHTYTHQAAVAVNVAVIGRSRTHDTGTATCAEGNDRGMTSGDQAGGVIGNVNHIVETTIGGGGIGEGEKGGRGDEEGSKGGDQDKEENQSETEEEDKEENQSEAEEEDMDEGELEEDYNGDEDEDRDFSKGYESEEEREYVTFGEGRERCW